MSEIEKLTKTLTQIVSSIQDMLSHPAALQSSHKTAPPLKKKPEMTYNQFLQIVLKNCEPIDVKSKYSSYFLQQDVQLLYDLSQYKDTSIKTFEKISKSKKLNRSTESLRSRYHDYLYLIREEEMKRIVSWIQKEGLKGYIVFDNEEMRIQVNDPKEAKKETVKRPRPKQHEEEIKGFDKFKKLRQKTGSKGNEKELADILKIYEKMMNIPFQTLVDRLHQLSGNLSDLNQYVETKDARMLWTPQEDEILSKGGKQLEVLIRFRGEENIETRKKYLGIP